MSEQELNYQRILRGLEPWTRWGLKLFLAHGPMTPETFEHYARRIHGDEDTHIIAWSTMRGPCTKLKQEGLLYVADNVVQVRNKNTAELLAVLGDPAPTGRYPKSMRSIREAVIVGRKRAARAGWFDPIEYE